MRGLRTGQAGGRVFVGPAAVLTNDPYPRSADLDGRLKRLADREARYAEIDGELEAMADGV
jgi:hypothetical protein